ncbi:MAG: hypothetical protein HY681_10645 [Chloroflexi bacterium]|nr:hypothetical protein [Chloroflexota bacterium]
MTQKQTYFEDIAEGTELPSKSWGPLDTVDIVRFGSAIDNYGKLHQDYYWCVDNGFSGGVLINGPMKQALLASWLDGIAGEAGFLKKMSIQHRGMDYADGRVLTAMGKVTGTREEDGLGYVECEIRLENSQGQITCPGTATLILPKRGGGAVPTEYEAPSRYSEIIGRIMGTRSQA